MSDAGVLSSASSRIFTSLVIHVSLSEALTLFSMRSGTTCSRFRTSFTPSIFRTSASAFAFSSAEFTLPCRVTAPSTVSTLTAELLIPLEVISAIFVLAVIQESDTAAPAGAPTSPATRAATASCFASFMLVPSLSLAARRTLRSHGRRSSTEQSDRQEDHGQHHEDPAE